MGALSQSNPVALETIRKKIEKRKAKK